MECTNYKWYHFRLYFPYHFIASFTFSFLQFFTEWGKIVLIGILCINVFYCLFWVIFFSPIYRTLLRRWAIPQHVIILLFASFSQQRHLGFFSEVWVTSSHFKCPVLFSVFWPILVTLKFEWSRIIVQFQALSAPLPSLWERSESSCYNLYNHHLHVPKFLLGLWYGRSTCPFFFRFVSFTFFSDWD